MTRVRHTPGAGVRKPPGEETASRVDVVVPRARRGRYGDLSGPDSEAACEERDRLRQLRMLGWSDRY